MSVAANALPTMPVRYAINITDAAAVHGVSPKNLFAAAGISFDADAGVEGLSERLLVTDFATLMEQAILLSGEPGLGYELGLQSSLTSHGIMSFGMLSCSTVRDAIAMGSDLLQLRVPILDVALRVENETAAVGVVETLPLGDLRETLFDAFLVKLARIGVSLTDGRLSLSDVELWFDYPEPKYYKRMKHRLPTMRFEMGSNEARFPPFALDLTPETADPFNASLVAQQCRQELEKLGLEQNIVAKVTALLQDAEGGYPTLSEVADQLHTSSRTLKRHLQDRGTSFYLLLDTARRARATQLLTTTDLSIEQIAHELGYADASGFRRAFHAWTGTNPSDARRRRRASV